MGHPRVLLADDHPLFCEGLVRLLEPRFQIVGTVTDGSLLVEAAHRLRPHVILLDISMPKLSGLDALRQLSAQRTDARTIILTMHADARIAREALRAGASGFVLKESSGDELLAALDAVLHGHTYLAAALTKDVLALLATPVKPDDVQLTPRQIEVLKLIVDGQRMKEIAGTLGLSPRTVETMKYQMMQTLRLRSTAELVRYAIQHRLVEL